ncbi:MAG: hypothetical protein PVS2B2_06330 [Candidatus Acidiferrum sp.]
MHFEKVAKIPREQKENKNNRAWENEADKALGEDIEGHRGGYCPAGEQRWVRLLPPAEEKVQRERDPESHGNVRDNDAGEKIWAKGRYEDHGGPEAGFSREKFAAKVINEEKQKQNAERHGKPCGEFGETEKSEGHGHAPIWQRRLFEIADAVFVQGDPVMAKQNFAPGLGVSGIGIVKKRRAEKSGAEYG